MDKKEYTFKEAESASLAADVYFPQKACVELPLALYFHGGNFTLGSKELLPRKHAERLVQLGFVVVSANYRLAPTISVYDGPVTDALDAYAWARTDLPELLKQDTGITCDGKRIVVLGHSCGATLALLTAGSPQPPRAILDIFGMKYLRDPSYHTPSSTLKLPPADKDFLNAVFKDRPPPGSGPPLMGPNGPDLANPRVAWMFHAIKEGKHLKAVIADDDYDRVDPAVLFGRPDFPPTYFIHGTADTLVPHRFSQQAYDELSSREVESRIELVSGGAHGFDARAQPGDEAFAVIERGFEFLRAHV